MLLYAIAAWYLGQVPAAASTSIGVFFRARA
jgi:hypothetical protein